MGDVFDEIYDSTPSVGSVEPVPTSQPDIFDEVYSSSSAAPSIGSSFTKGLMEAPGAAVDAVKSIPSGLSNLFSSIFSPKESLANGTTENTLRGVGSLAAGTAGAGAGALAGAPLAPLTLGLSVPVGAAIGGASGLLGFDWLNQWTGSDAATTPEQDAAKLAEATGQGVTLGVAGSALKSAGNLVSEGAPKLAEVLNRKSIGARQGDFAKSLKQGLAESADGETTTNLANSIEQVRQEGGFDGTRDPVKLLDKNTASLDTLENNLTDILKTADQVNTSSPIIPKYDIAEGWIKTQPASEQAALSSALDEIKSAHNSLLDGTLEGLQAEKRALYGKTYGESGAAKEALSKYVAADLKTAIENGVDDLVTQGKLSSDVAGSVKALNESSGTYQDVRPILKRGVAQSMTDDPIAKLANIGFTTGGIGAPTIAGGVIGGPVGSAIGAALGLAGKALTTKTGQALSAKALRGASDITSPVSSLLNKVLTPEAIGAAEAAGDISPKESQSLKLAAKVLSKPELFNLDQGDMDNTPKKIPTLKNDIVAQIDSNPLDKTIFEMESNRGKAVTNKESSAKGAFQLIDSTAKKLGVGDVFDLGDNYKGYLALKAENAARFGDDPVDLYGAHFLGATIYDKYLEGKPLTDRQQELVDQWETIVKPRFIKKYAANARLLSGVTEV